MEYSKKNEIEQFLNYLVSMGINSYIRASMVPFANAVYEVLDGLLEGRLAHENETSNVQKKDKKKEDGMDGESSLCLEFQHASWEFT